MAAADDDEGGVGEGGWGARGEGQGMMSGCHYSTGCDYRVRVLCVCVCVCVCVRACVRVARAYW